MRSPRYRKQYGFNAIAVMPTNLYGPGDNFDLQSSLTIAELVLLVRRTVGFEGAIEFDQSKADGSPRKLLDVTKLTSLGWRAKTPFADGLQQTYAWYLENRDTVAA